jgi:hypothetical protein
VLIKTSIKELIEIEKEAIRSEFFAPILEIILPDGKSAMISPICLKLIINPTKPVVAPIDQRQLKFLPDDN